MNYEYLYYEQEQVLTRIEEWTFNNLSGATPEEMHGLLNLLMNHQTEMKLIEENNMDMDVSHVHNVGGNP